MHLLRREALARRVRRFRTLRKRGGTLRGLNVGDCATYAVAKVADKPLLCLRDNFAQTGLALV
jgi:uncharacterized protein with PIN domain